MRGLAVLAAGLLLAGCVSVDIDASLACADGLKARTTAELFFGRNIGEAPGVSDADWKQFVDEEVTTRFPDGLTVIDAAGQWRAADGVIVREPSKVLLLILSGEPGEQEKIEAIRTAYKTRFRQEAVLLIERRGCVGI